jgi:hypothetical protein
MAKESSPEQRALVLLEQLRRQHASFEGMARLAKALRPALSGDHLVILDAAERYAASLPNRRLGDDPAIADALEQLDARLAQRTHPRKPTHGT